MIKYQIHGYDNVLVEPYINPTLYDTYAEARAHAHSNREWVVKIKI